MRTSMTEREKESSSAAVKRPQQPKEILEKNIRQKGHGGSERAGEETAPLSALQVQHTVNATVKALLSQEQATEGNDARPSSNLTRLAKILKLDEEIIRPPCQDC